MVEIEIVQENGARARHVLSLPVLIGRDECCGVRLRSWRIAREHAKLTRHAGDLLLEDLGSWQGTWVNQKRISRYGPLLSEDTVVIGSYRIMVRQTGVLVPTRHESDGGAPALVMAASSAAVSGRQHDVPPIYEDNSACEPEPGLSAEMRVGVGARSQEAVASAMQGSPGMAVAPAAGVDAPDYVLVRRLHKVLLQELDLRRRNVEDMNDAALRSQAIEALNGWLARQSTQLGSDETGLPVPVDAVRRDGLLQTVLDEALGYGPLQPLLADDSVTEIMVNGHDEIYVERQGRLHRHSIVFSSESALMAVMERMVAPLGRRLDENMPLADARLPDGSRVHAAIRPVSVRGPVLTVRRFPVRRPGLDELISLGALDADMAGFLAQCVRFRRNIVVAGGTGSGKTTLLNALSHCIDRHERVITIEDAAELHLQHEHRVILEARPPNQEGQGAIPIRELVRNALRMRPDRIIVGECRGAEALDMLAAMNTGHEGSLTTLHANSPRDALSRLETMVLMAGMDLPLAVVREQIAASVDILVQLVRLTDGRRVVSEVTEVCGIESQCLQTMMLFTHDRRSGRHRRGENIPAFFEEWRRQGVHFDPAPFAFECAPHDALRAVALDLPHAASGNAGLAMSPAGQGMRAANRRPGTEQGRHRDGMPSGPGA